MQFDAIVLVEARSFYHFDLLVVESTVNSYFFAIKVERREAYNEFFIHLVSFETWIFKHLHRHLIFFRIKDALLVESAVNHLQNLVFFCNFCAHVSIWIWY